MPRRKTRYLSKIKRAANKAAEIHAGGRGCGRAQQVQDDDNGSCQIGIDTDDNHVAEAGPSTPPSTRMRMCGAGDEVGASGTAVDDAIETSNNNDYGDGYGVGNGDGMHVGSNGDCE
jgi:hypothetical protein